MDGLVLFNDAIIEEGDVTIPFDGRSLSGTLKLSRKFFHEETVRENVHVYVEALIEVTVPIEVRDENGVDGPWRASSSVRLEMPVSTHAVVAQATAALIERIQSAYDDIAKVSAAEQETARW